MKYFFIIVFVVLVVIFVVVVDWKEDYVVFKFGIFFGENEKDCIVCYILFE